MNFLRDLVVILAILSSGCSGPNIPTAVAKVYVADEDGNSISIIDANTNVSIATIDLSEGMQQYMPHNVQVSPDGRTVWASAMPIMEDSSDGTVMAGSDIEQVIVIDSATDTIIHRIALGSDLHLAHVVLDETSRFAYVTANEADKVFRIDASSFEVVEEYSLAPDSAPHGMRFCGGRLFVADMGSLGMSIIDTSTGFIEDVYLGGVTVQTACTPDGKYAFASLYDTVEVIRYEIGSGLVLRTPLPEGVGPIQLYSSPDSTRLYVADQGMLMDRPASNRLFELDVATAMVSAVITVGQGAHGVVVSDDGRLAYVTNTADDTVSVVDTAERRGIATVAVGAAPNGISHLHVGGGMP